MQLTITGHNLQLSAEINNSQLVRIMDIIDAVTVQPQRLNNQAMATRHPELAGTKAKAPATKRNKAPTQLAVVAPAPTFNAATKTYAPCKACGNTGHTFRGVVRDNPAMHWGFGPQVGQKGRAYLGARVYDAAGALQPVQR